MDYPLVEKAQRLPEDHASGGAERVLSLSDRLWFKVKIGEYRGAAGEVSSRTEETPSLWWLVAGGLRRADTKAQDFYKQLEAECVRSAKLQKNNTEGISSTHLLPQDIDYRRYKAEQVALGVEALQKAVCEAICMSAHSGKPAAATTSGQRLIAWVKSSDGDTYLAIAAEGYLDPKEIAVLLNSVPGMSSDDWASEPGEVLGITPEYGQLVFSAMLPPESLAAILEDSAGGDL